ncbi:MAG TPA: flagellar biosynthetic protein FliO, partial [Pirellulales bacterium]|nr:flagellar biosynthetic protein FliO [Pirellulales bacterium]
WRCTFWLMALTVAAGTCERAIAIDPFEVPPRELPRVDPWNRGPTNVNDKDLNRPVDAGASDPAPPRPFPVKFQSAERQETAQGVVEQDRSPKTLQLTPPSPDSRPGVRTGEIPSLVTGAASLGIVLGLFLLVVLVVRRGMPKNAALLPREAVEVLGRGPLVGKQQVHLVRCGNKILLVCALNAGVTTLTEITDPAEVERLTGLCQQGRPASASFRQVFQQFDQQPHALDFPSRQQGEELDFGRLDAAGFHRTQESHA